MCPDDERAPASATLRPSRELVERAVKGDASARTELKERYRPVLAAFARRVGLSEEGLASASAAALRGLLEAEPVDPATPMRERLFAQARVHVAGASLSASDVLQSEAAMREVWDAEWRRGLLRAAMRLLSRSHDTDARMLQAYDLHVVEKRPVGEVARELGMSHTAVHSAKNLILGALTAALERLEGDY
jgi:hypothetical protein